ncbi:Arc family DNA-binding protein [Pseudomonas aeruginosa]|nr:Arc family DNA-binding protein [Pseudomonas aeruginosa]
MSREDPQFKLRMPQDLRQQAEQAAKAAGRSLNAELVTRIESSFLNSSTQEVLMPAKRAKELALMAREGNTK